MSHRNAALTPRHRRDLARQIIDEGWSVSAGADYFRVSYPTAAKWARRYVELGPDGMTDRSSRPHRHPNKTPIRVVKQIVHLRIRKRLGPVQIAGRLGMPASTVHAVLVRCRLNRLSDNGSASCPHAWRNACTDLQITPKFTRPRRPQTNGKIERFHRTLADGWAYSKHYPSESARRDALPGRLHFYNHHRPHTATEKHPPINRITNNPPGHYT